MPLRSLTKVFPLVSMQAFIQLGDVVETLHSLFNGEFFAQVSDVLQSAGLLTGFAEVMQFAADWGVL
ncbi:hypothetical protein Q4544_04870 [Cognatishimia sp. 1_MG-2023]|uniref:hypothetical protein n=1 Tax=Cognatishimia sp. 1_MG-2023 TaxID=3062642 RepID=UPI0026E48E75|nr:hypothetical protein [Cognatishimia sp. 1_MG-2023]MDO6726261.1 hypothetical protein [Cognatishimia sp. 1_MG-2023]